MTEGIIPNLQQAEAIKAGCRVKLMRRSRRNIGSSADVALITAERLLRQVYWSWPALRRWRRNRERRRVNIQECGREDLRSYLRGIGVKTGALVLLHSRVTGLNIDAGDSAPGTNGCNTPEIILSDVLDLLGASGTLAMPTNPIYQRDILEERRTPSQIDTYDPERTPSAVGLISDFFWRQRGVKRSLFPFNTLAAYGPLADELFQGNLNERKPSPHGVDSSYYRICQHNGLVISIGVPLRDCLTLAHVVEEVRPDWQIRDFFAERRYEVVQNGTSTQWTVRLPREEYDRFCPCRKKMGRDLVAEGIIHEWGVGTVRVDWARAGEIYDFFWRKTEKRPYPYYGLWLVRKPWLKKDTSKEQGIILPITSGFQSKPIRRSELQKAMVCSRTKRC